MKMFGFTLKMSGMALFSVMTLPLSDMRRTEIPLLCSTHNIPTEKHGASINVNELRVLLIQHLSDAKCELKHDNSGDCVRP